MAEEVQMQEVGKGPRKRNIAHKKGKGKKKMKVFHGSGQQKVKMDGKTKKLFRKRARDYNSDNSDNEDANDIDEGVPKPPMKFKKKQVHDENEEEEEEEDEKSSDEEMDEDADVSNEVSDDEDGEIQPGIMKFFEGNTSFKKAFKKIIKRSGSDDVVLGPVLSAHKKLVVKKLAQEADERKVKGDAKKEKTLLGQKGHVKPDAFSLPHEKLLIGIATKGVVKLFNAVNKAQSSQKGLNPSRSKDAKVIQKRRKEAFFSELSKPSSGSNAMVSTSGGGGEGPAWAPLRDNYMLTTSKLKDWDKTADGPEATDDYGRQEDSSSDEDD